MADKIEYVYYSQIIESLQKAMKGASEGKIRSVRRQMN